MYILEKVLKIESAHQLKDSESLTTKKCQNVHGHNWIITVKVSTHELIDDMVIDFGALKDIVGGLDHKFLNDIIDVQPTAENISRYIYDEINKYFDNQKSERICLVEVTVQETEGASATYRI